MPYIPHTPADVQSMLKAMGFASVEDLFAEVPAALRAQELNAIPTGLNAFECAQHARSLCEQDHYAYNFLGAGAYEHHIPAAVWDITSRGEFLTAYTPYQPEASQGTLQLIYEYQTMMASLMGLDVSNASMYDGASALAEAILMAARLSRVTQPKVFVPRTVHPHYREVLRSVITVQGIQIVEIDYDRELGIINPADLTKLNLDSAIALVIPQPNFFGQLEDVDALSNWAKQNKLFVIATANPMSVSWLREPGSWGESGADIACGEGQPLGIPLASGGPYFGFLTCKKEYVRQMPGRIVGRTIDKQGRQGFVLTLQAREQHIRRAKATSNICTNQGLLVTAATIYMSLLGAKGLQTVAQASYQNTAYLRSELQRIAGVQCLFQNDHFHEIVVQLPSDATRIHQKLVAKGIEPGLLLEPYYPELKNTLLICATETKSIAAIDHFVAEINALIHTYADLKPEDVR